MDETGAPTGNADGGNPTGKRGWLWVAMSPFVTVFLQGLSRLAAAANELVSHPGWDLSVTTKLPLSDEVLEILCGCRSARLHLPSLSSQSVGPQALAALQTRGLG